MIEAPFESGVRSSIRDARWTPETKTGLFSAIILEIVFLVLLELTTFVESEQLDNATLELVDLWLEFLSKFATL